MARERKACAGLAELYGAPIKRFNEQVRLNLERFPADFMFQLTEEEWESLRSQIATLKPGRGQHRKYMPYAFTEHGAIMAATILNSPRTTEALAMQHDTFARNTRVQLKQVFELMTPPEPQQKRPIGFISGDEKPKKN